MRAVLTRVRSAEVRVDDSPVGAIGPGLLALVGVAPSDGPAQVAWLADKIRDLRCFPGPDGRPMDRAVHEVGGAVLVVSQFTLLADCRRGRRPDFTAAAAPAHAAPLIDALVDRLRATGLPVETGRFGAHMAVSSINDGPVTLLLDTP
jgi:D-tyrosyl-tRNA(Tyr) deacylase